jgi:para-nitrobenzyl esterase
LIVTTQAGVVQGKVENGSDEWLGIPYAEPPVGNLRWRPPVPKQPWANLMDATSFGRHCLQEGDFAASEDCLFLNVYAPHMGSGKRLHPVMVWIHGGANAAGAGDFYNPTPLVQAGGVVVVTLNYRVNVFGFLANPSIDSEGHPFANYGIMDQQLALHWVRDNIGKFGGDPDNVTIFGQSAGGSNVATHLVSALSRGLFHKAIIQSGGWQIDTPSLEESEARGAAFARQVGCETDTASCMRSLAGRTLLAHAGVVDTPSGGFDQSTVDGVIITESKRTALKSGHVAKVPVLVGSNSDDGHYEVADGMTADGFRGWVEYYAPDLHKPPSEILATYPLSRYKVPADAARAIAGDYDQSCSSEMLTYLLRKQVPTYWYEFGDAPPGAVGADHGAEVPYLFARKDRLSPASTHLSQIMRATWTNFATTGAPQASEVSPTWPDVSTGLVVFRTPKSEMLTRAEFTARHRCWFWNKGEQDGEF